MRIPKNASYTFEQVTCEIFMKNKGGGGGGRGDGGNSRGKGRGKENLGKVILMKVGGVRLFELSF